MLQPLCTLGPTDAVLHLDSFCRASLSIAQTRVGTVDPEYPAIIPRSEDSEAIITCANEALGIDVLNIQNHLG